MYILLLTSSVGTTGARVSIIHGPTSVAGRETPIHTQMHSEQSVPHPARQWEIELTANTGQTAVIRRLVPFTPFLFFHACSFPNHLNPSPFHAFIVSPKTINLNILRRSSLHPIMRPTSLAVTPSPSVRCFGDQSPVDPQCWWPSSPWGWGSPGTGSVGSGSPVSGILGSPKCYGASVLLHVWGNESLPHNLTKYTIAMSWATATESRNLTSKVQKRAQ